MIVRCRTAWGKGLPQNFRGLFYTERSVFHVTEGLDYEVYGLSLFNAGLVVLLKDDSGVPNWYPVEFFTVLDGKIPEGWHFGYHISEDSNTDAFWGYEQLVNDPTHQQGLLERDPAALDFFDRVIRRSNYSDGG